jgi:sterol desaturase/sphingolipid hydroxylase (fatty acid hydroxylase superfamily)
VSPATIGLDALRLLAVIGLSAAFFVPLELWMTRGRRVRPPLAVDVTNVALLAVGALMAAAAAALVAARWPAMVRLDAPPSWPRFAASFVLAEVLGYGVHRAMHASPTLWRFHRVHHGDHVDWLATWRMHPVDAALHLAATITPAVLFQVPLAAHAAAAMGRKLYTAFLHAQGAWRTTWLDRVVATPAFHHRHHDERAAPANFAGMLAALDLVLGTWRAGRR